MVELLCGIQLDIMTQGITLSPEQEDLIDQQIDSFTTSTVPTFISSFKLVWLLTSHKIKVDTLQLKVVHIEQSNLEQAITDLKGRKPYAAVFYHPKTDQYFQRDTYPIPTICVGIDFWEKDQKLKPGSRFFFKLLRKAGLTIQIR